jgi:hypothetical protein
MEAVSRAFYETVPRSGLVIGVVPARVEPLEALERRESVRVGYEVPTGYPNEWVELAIYTHLPDSGSEGTLRSSRNHINVLTADVIVALPGQEGTASEIWLAVQYRVPIIAYGAYRAHRADEPSGAFGAAGPDRDDGTGSRIPRASSPCELAQFLRDSM